MTGRFSEKAKLIEDIKKASVNGVAPATTRGLGQALCSRANRIGFAWDELCQEAGLRTARQARWGHEFGEGGGTHATAIRRERRLEREKEKERRKAFLEHECAKCLWSRIVDQKTIFCMAPSGWCMKHIMAGRVDHGTVKSQGGNEK